MYVNIIIYVDLKRLVKIVVQLALIMVKIVVQLALIMVKISLYSAVYSAVLVLLVKIVVQ